LSGRPPFRGKSKEEILHNIMTKPVSFGHKNWEKISPEAKMFVKACLNCDPKKRPTAQQLINDNWIQSNLADIEVSEDKMLNISENL
jgi:calcium/calmodulin-dependent protein kinase I